MLKAFKDRMSKGHEDGGGRVKGLNSKYFSFPAIF